MAVCDIQYINYYLYPVLANRLLLWLIPLYLFLKVLNFVRVAVQSRKVNLLSVDLDTDGSWWYTLAIDSRLQEFTVSLSGNRPRIVLKDPDGKKCVLYSMQYLDLRRSMTSLSKESEGLQSNIYGL